MLVGLLVLMTGLGEVSAVDCQSGYYTYTATLPQGSTMEACQVCPAGHACAAATTRTPTACSAGTYAPAGSLACLACPAGHTCADPATVPTLCAVGQVPNAGKTACVGCAAGSACPGPDKAVATCSTPTQYSLAGASECTSCPAGQACRFADAAGSACPSNTAATFGAGTCAATPVGGFAPQKYVAAQTCPAGLVALGSPNERVRCDLCPQGQACTSSAASGASACPTGKVSALGSTTCSDCPAGYSCPSANPSDIVACADGQYSNAALGTCVSCPVGDHCSYSGVLGTCAVGTWSPAGAFDCRPCPYAHSCSPTAVAACAANQYVDTSSAAGYTCQACPNGFECLDKHTKTPCEKGWVRTTPGACTICPAGSFCPDATTTTPCSAGTFSDAGATSCYTCPAGTACSGTTARNGASVAACSSGWSKGSTGAGACSEAADGSYVLTPDASAATQCPAGFFSTAAGQDMCHSSSTTKQAGATPGTTSTGLVTCAANTNLDVNGVREYGIPGGSACITCDDYEPCNIDQQGKNSSCAPGSYFDKTNNACVVSVAASGKDIFVATIDSRAVNCAPGFMRIPTDASDTSYQCIQCPDTQVCLIVPGQAKWENNWCYLKDPAVNYGSLGLLVDQQRLPAYEAKWCIDCKAQAIKDQICTFATNYFTTHDGVNITCPARAATETRTQQGASYAAKAHFWSDTSIYPYPYCQVDLNYYLNTPVVTTNVNQAHIKVLLPNAQLATPASYSATCGNTEFDWKDINYPACARVYPGFDSGGFLGPSRKMAWPAPPAQPSAAYYQLGAGTDHQMTALTCPVLSATTAATSQIGGVIANGDLAGVGMVDEHQACRLWDVGTCTVATADYCQDGTDLTCPLGYAKTTTSPNQQTISDCVPCTAGKVCSTSTEAACPAGYFCAAYTEDEKTYASPPGTTTTGLDNAIPSSLTACVGRYCPPATTTPKACDVRYQATLSNLADAAGCRPHLPGRYFDTASNALTTCTKGNFCPEGSAAKVQSPPGYVSVSADAESKDDLTGCTAGYFCDEGSAQAATSYANSCPGGHYCPATLLFAKENACAEGTHSQSVVSGFEGSMTGASSCQSCAPGEYCPAGSAASGAGGPKVCPKHAWCEAGDHTPRNCPAGKQVDSESQTSANACTDCAKGYWCPSGFGSVKCPGGSYQSSEGKDSCIVSPEGVATGTAGGLTAILTAQNCAAGSHARPGATVCYPCEAGSACAGDRAQTICAAGTAAAAGAATCATCSAGTDCRLTGLPAPQPCPSGYACPTPASAPVPAPIGFFSIGGTAATSTAGLSSCNSGYTCTSTGAIGPHAAPCEAGTYAGASSSTCGATQDGSYTLRAAVSQTTCPAGFYCHQSEQYWPRACPRGTFGASTGLGSAAACAACTGGKTCDLPGLAAVYGECNEGYYCSAGAWTPSPNGAADPTEAPTGGLCTAGHFCPKSAAVPSPCAAGTYLSSPGMRKATDCLSCPAGSYCAGTGSAAPTGKCSAGYYCTGAEGAATTGASSAQEADTPAGSYTPEGSAQPIQCPPGTYSSAAKQVACTPCDAGKSCPTRGMTAGTACTAGVYCPLENGVGTVHPKTCLAGTYQPQAAAAASGACLACQIGKVCADEGLATSGASCAAGFICWRRAFTTTPARSLGTPASSAACTAACSCWSDDFGLCPPGHHCASGATCPTACPAGTIQPAEGATAAAACLACPAGSHCGATGLAAPSGTCPAGFFCTSGTTAAAAAGSGCPPGHKCPAGTPLAVACPPGSYQPSAGEASCLPCEAGKYCLEGAAAALACPENHYCLAGTILATQYPCPAGKSTGGATGATSATACTNVGPADWIKVPGQTATDNIAKGTVAAGYSNPSGGATHTQPSGASLCTRGYLCNSGVAAACPAGSFCADFGLSAVATSPTGVAPSSGPCAAGHWCPAGATSPVPTAATGVAVQGLGGLCDLGYWCGSGTLPLTTGGAAGPTACAAGTWAAGIGLRTASECSSCPPGHVCAATGITSLSTHSCPAGAFCLSGLASTSTAGTCAAGYHCPAGSPEQRPCGEGTYQPATGQASCTACSAGNYCPYSASGIPAEIPCPVGHYCPASGSTQPPLISPTPCPPGSYTDAPGAQACTSCPAGAYCASEALTTAGTPCPAGYWCPAGAIDYQGSRCPAGSHCPAGSAAAVACPAGKYCQGEGLDAPSGDCMAGYYCLGGAVRPNPADDPTGARCPKGAYCPAGASAPTKCAAGTYSDKLGASASSFCLACPAGLTCTLVGLPAPSSDCPAGKHCQGATQADCSTGHYCPAGEAAELVCPPGSHQSQTGQATCATCPAGSYCGSDSSHSGWGGIVTPVACPAGYYCPAGTPSEEAYPCPSGSHGAGTGLQSEAACTTCPLGQYCDRPGLLAPSGACLDGFSCTAGSSAATGTGPCPADSYCIGGSTTACPPGTYSGGPGAAKLDECIKCPPGQVCPDHARGLVPCPAGRYCVGGALSAADSDPAVYVCTAGHYCPTGSALPLQCLPGTSSSATGATTCTLCPAGTYCPSSGLTAPLACPADRECATAGTVQPRVCPPGQSADGAGACTACPAGKYCWPEPGTNGIATDACDPLYVCQSGSASKTPYPSDMRSIQPAGSDFLAYNGPAYPGQRAEAASRNVPCLAGTYRPGLYGSACLTCPAGRYCGESGMSSIDSYVCAGGQLCAEGATTSTPAYAGTTTLVSALCPAGFFCPAGARHPLRCADGYYGPSVGAALCTACPAGSYCNGVGLPTSWDGTTAINGGRTVCPRGIECGGGTAYQPLCAAGQRAAGAGCTDCSPGSYCRGGQVAGNCAAGYLCRWGTSEPNPWAYPCPVGSYCPHGATSALPCPSGTMGKEGSTVSGAKQASDCTGCQPGWLCPLSRRGAKPCPPGYYCPLLASAAVPCPRGTWSSEGLLVTEQECEPCPAGYACSTTAIASLTDYECPVGHYCPASTADAIPCPAGTYRNETGGEDELDCQRCPTSYHCPVATNQPKQCFDGTYCRAGAAMYLTVPGGSYSNAGTRYQMAACPYNHRCPRGAKEPQRCAGRTLCPPASETGVLCPAGSYVRDNSAYLTTDSCLICGAGQYSTLADTLCHQCEPGHLCYGNTTRKFPTSVAAQHGELCPKGHYCPRGSKTPSACPEGTFNDRLGAAALTDCLLCDAGSYNDLTGQSGCRPCGAFAISDEGAITCRCLGRFRVFSLTDSSCRCSSGYDAADEQGELRGQESGKEDCTPLVFDRCEQANQTRSAEGGCVDVSDCSVACGPQGGVRSEVVGVCTCNQDLGVDNVCNQGCRKSAPQLSLVSGTTVRVTDPSGGTKLQDLTQVGDVYGDPACAAGGQEDCTVRSAGQDASGAFLGGYSPPALVGQKIRRLDEKLQLRNSKNRLLSDEEFPHRELQPQTTQAAGVETAPVRNPVYCIVVGSSFLFTISDPKHYPVYLRDSVLNTNPDFDYGAFLDLQGEMAKKVALQVSTPSLFAFSFTQAGIYAFGDAEEQRRNNTAEQLMVITVMAAGETCTDPDRYVQSISGSALSAFGVPQRQDIIIGPDYPLLVGLACILLLATGTVMVLIAYCLHKQWTIQKVRREGYRGQHIKVDIAHDNEVTYGKAGNDFAKHRAAPDEESSGEEDDLDDVNMDIYQDLVEVGKQFLDVYENARNKRKRQQKGKRAQLIQLLRELATEIGSVGQDAHGNDMQVYDPAELEGAGAGNMDGEKAQERAERARQLQEERENRERAAEQAQKEKLDRDCSQRDKEGIEAIKNAVTAKVQRAQKELGRDLDQYHTNVLVKRDGEEAAAVAAPEAMAYAVYDQDAKSRLNQAVKKIDESKHLEEAEKEALLASHQQGVGDIEKLMEAERKKQERDMDAMMRLRLERRKKRAEGRGKGAVKDEERAATQAIDAELDKKAHADAAAVEREAERKLQEAKDAHVGDAVALRELSEKARLEKDDALKKVEQEAEAQRKVRIKEAQEEVRRKHAQGAQTTEEFEQALVGIVGDDEAAAKAKIKAADEVKKQALEESKQELKKQQAALLEKLKKDKEMHEQELETVDLVQEEEAEKTRIEALKKAGLFDGREREKEAEKQKDRMNKALAEIDHNDQKNTLMDQLANQGLDMEALLALEQARQADRLAARRELLKQRRRNKKNQELEGARVAERARQMEATDQAEAAAHERFVEDIFKEVETGDEDGKLASSSAAGADQHNTSHGSSKGFQNKQQKEKKAQMLNEYLAEADFERFGNLLAKQLVEKEQYLKLLLAKYADQRLAETEHAKAQLRDDYGLLDKLKEESKIDEATHRDGRKKLAVSEANVLRELELGLEKAHKEEEAELRQRLDKEHIEEQIALQRTQAEAHARLRKKLLGEQEAAEEENLDTKALEKFTAVKKQEQEKRQRTTEAERRTVARQIELQLQDQIKDHEELLHRKREAQAAMQSEASEIRKRLADRKRKMAEQSFAGLTEEEKAAMMERFKAQYDSLGFALEDERNRQAKALAKKAELRKQKLERTRKMKLMHAGEQERHAELERASGLHQALQNVQVVALGTGNDELLRLLRLWAAGREQHHRDAEAQKIATTTVNLDANLLTRLILKLVQVEKSLKEYRRLKKYRIRGQARGKAKRGGAPSSAIQHQASVVSSSRMASSIKNSHVGSSSNPRNSDR